MADERTLQSQRMYEGRILNVRLDTVMLADGSTTSRETVEHVDSVLVVPINYDKEVLLVSQYRKSPEKRLMEVPCGGMEKGEQPDQAAIRELREETGFTAGQLRKMAGFWIAPGFCDEYMHAYVATALMPSPLEADVDEMIDVVPVPLDTIIDSVLAGDIEDSKSIAALMMVIYVYGSSL